MKKQAYMIVTMVMFIAVVGLSSAKAQTSGPTILRVDIPFDFTVGNQTLPAGEYRVTCLNSASDLKVLQLREKAGRVTMLVRTSSVIGKTHDNATLVFNRYGEQYFFAQAWLVGDNTGMQAQKSRIEKVTARELASIKRATEVVALTAKR
jgi:hypothetical protein